MKNYSIRALLLALLPLCIAFTCSDHRNPEPLRYRLKSVTFKRANAGSGLTANLTYNSQGQLASYDAGPMSGSTLFILTRNQDRVSDLYYLFRPKTAYRNLYTYNAQGQLTNINRNVVVGADLQLTTSFDYTYDGNSPTPSSRRISIPYTPVSTANESYVFTNGNATQINGRAISYDNSPNPYKGLFGLNMLPTLGIAYEFNNLPASPIPLSEPFADLSIKVFNQNNITTDATLTYNSGGLVTRVVYSDGNTEDFTYESF